MRTLECCVDTLEAARNAIAGGANRIELCGNLIIGGTTPSAYLYEAIRRESSVEIRAMIRPRYGDFLYTESELDIMEAEIRQFRQMGCNGVVFGVLTADGGLDRTAMARLREAAGEMKATLHRAFDVTADPFDALETARQLGMDTILTSGQKQNAGEGAVLIKELVARSGGIEILVGSGVSAEVISALGASTGARSFHLSGRVAEDSPMTYRKPEISMGLPGISEYARWNCSTEKIAVARKALDNLTD